MTTHARGYKLPIQIEVILYRILVSVSNEIPVPQVFHQYNRRSRFRRQASSPRDVRFATSKIDYRSPVYRIKINFFKSLNLISDRLSHVCVHLRATRLHWGKNTSLTIIAKDVRIRIIPLIWIKYFFVEDHLVIHYLTDFHRWRFDPHEDERYSIRLHMISRRRRILVLTSFSEIFFLEVWTD